MKKVCIAFSAACALSLYQPAVICQPIVPEGYTIENYATGIGAATALAIGPDGSLYITDYATGQLLKRTASESLEVVASGLPNSNALAILPSGRIFAGANSFYIYEIVGGVPQLFASGFSYISSMALKGDDLYVSSEDGISKVSTITGSVTMELSGVVNPFGVSFDDAGNMYFLSHALGEVYTYNFVDPPKFLANVTPYGGTFTGVGFGNRLFWGDYSLGALFTLGSDGNSAEFATGFVGANPPANGPNAIVARDAGVIFVADGPNVWRIFDPTLTNPQASAVTLTPNVASPAAIGATVTFTAAAGGGSGNYQYKFLLRAPGGTLNTVRDYSTSASWSWNTSGLVAGTYQVVVHARNVGSTKSYETYQSLGYGLVTPTPASAVTMTPSVASPATVGATVTFTAAASGGSGNYQYKFLLRPPGGTLNTVRDYSTTASWSWNTSGLVAGTYQVVVHARNVGSTKSYETYQSISYGLVNPASVVSLTPSPVSPAVIGTTVTFNASAGGGSGNYQYKFLLRAPGGTLNTVRDYSTSASWSWNTSGLVAGTYQVVVHARNVGSTKSYETYQSLGYGLVTPTPASAVTMTPSVASPATVGATVTFTAAASGGSGNYQYKFLLRPPSGMLNTVRDYSTTASWSWNTSGLVAGTYQVVVHARNVGSTKSYETYQSLSYLLKPQPPEYPETEYNDERALADTFYLNSTAVGSLANAYDVDWFTVSIDQQITARVTFDVTSTASGVWNVYWYDQNLNVLSGRNISASPTVFVYEFPAFSPGPYYMRIQPTDPALYGGSVYKVTVTSSP